jgi:hypothetical protein
MNDDENVDKKKFSDSRTTVREPEIGTPPRISTRMFAGASGQPDRSSALRDARAVSDGHSGRERAEVHQERRPIEAK